MKPTIKDIPFTEIQIGTSASLSKTITQEDVLKFADVTNDYNPVHVDPDFAAQSMFKKQIAHGMISAGLISAVLGTQLPGMNTIYMGQDLSFKNPVFLDDTLTATVECIDKHERRHVLTFKTMVTNQDGKVVTEGSAKVLKR